MSPRLRLVGRYFATASESVHTVRKKPHYKLQRRLVLLPFERVTASKSTCPDLIQTNSKSWNRGLNSGTLGNDSKNPAEITGGKYCNPNSRCELRSPRVTHGSREKLNHPCASRTLASVPDRLFGQRCQSIGVNRNRRRSISSPSLSAYCFTDSPINR